LVSGVRGLERFEEQALHLGGRSIPELEAHLCSGDASFGAVVVLAGSFAQRRGPIDQLFRSFALLRHPVHVRGGDVEEWQGGHRAGCFREGDPLLDVTDPLFDLAPTRTRPAENDARGQLFAAEAAPLREGQRLFR
jgi:hypothetical protein